MTRHIAIVTTARSDYGLLEPVVGRVAERADLRLTLLAGGMHLSPRHGRTIDEVRAGPHGDRVVEVPAGAADLPDTAAVAAARIGWSVTAFAEAYGRWAPDMLVVLGDRYDMLPAVLAALPMTIPVAHISGGDVTEGVIDDCIRHAVSKMSHLHFPSLPDYARRLRQLGEEAWRIAVVGEPGLDHVAQVPMRPKAEFYAELGLDPARQVSLFTLHPETLQPAASAGLLAEVLSAARDVRQACPGSQILFTYPNADPGSAAIAEGIETFARREPDCGVVKSLGRIRYVQMLRHCDCMVGNSSSGVIEAASFRLPVVDIGDRQRGRVAPRNVQRVPAQRAAIAEAWIAALAAGARTALTGLVNPYGDGRSSERIVERLAEVPIDRRLLTKRFVDLPPGDVPD